MRWKLFALLAIRLSAVCGSLPTTVEEVPTPHVFVINLAHRVDRMEHIRNQLQLSGLNYTRIDAADARFSKGELASGRAAVNETYRDAHGDGRRMKIGEVGCALSHMNAWREIARTVPGDEYAIVLEDDAEFRSSHGDVDVRGLLGDMSSAAARLDVEFVYLARKELVPEDREVIDGRFKTCVYSWWTLAYMIRSDAARRLSEDAEAYRMSLIPVDEYLPIVLGVFDRKHDSDEHARDPSKNDNLPKACDAETAGTVGDGDDPRYRNVRLSCLTVKEDIVFPRDGFQVQSDTETSEIVGYNNVDHTERTRLANQDGLMVVTVATDESHFGYQTLLSSADYFGYRLHTLGLGQMWTGGDLVNTQGGGLKLLLMKQFISQLSPADDESLILFTDGYDTVFQLPPSELLDRAAILLEKFDVVFGAELPCWPDKALCARYDHLVASNAFDLDLTRFRYLNSGNYIGKVRHLRHFIEDFIDTAASDDQRYFHSKLVESLEGGRGDKIGDVPTLGIDTNCELFQPLNHMGGGEWEMENAVFRNKITGTRPVILHGNGPSMRTLIGIGNYVAGSFSRFYGNMRHVRIPEEQAEIYPLAIGLFFIGTPFEVEFLEGVQRLDIDNNHVDLYVYYGTMSRLRLDRSVQQAYRSFTVLNREDDEEDSECVARSRFANLVSHTDARYMLMVDSDTIITRRTTVSDLAAWNQTVVAGHSKREDQVWSNFWSDMSSSGWYSRGFDTLALYDHEYVGLWQVPFARGLLLIRADVSLKLAELYAENGSSADDCSRRVCIDAAHRGLPFYVDNRYIYATLLGNDVLKNPGAPFPEVYEVDVNPSLWFKRYLVPNYDQLDFDEVCQDAYGAVLFTKRFCDEMVATVAAANNWSSGDHDDAPIEGGHDNFPTQDIHVKQFLWEDQWLYILKTVLQPLISPLYEGFKFKGEINTAFIVSFGMDGQRDLVPHNDASDLTTTVTLNSDFTGGGVEFTRYNCTHVSKTPGFLLVHPGRITHNHRSLPITSGKRYEIASFNY